MTTIPLSPIELIALAILLALLIAASLLFAFWKGRALGFSDRLRLQERHWKERKRRQLQLFLACSPILTRKP